MYADWKSNKQSGHCLITLIGLCLVVVGIRSNYFDIQEYKFKNRK